MLGGGVRIASVEIKKPIDGLSTFPMDSLNGTVVLAGENGSGKTRLLKLIERTVRAAKNKEPYNGSDALDISYTDDTGQPVDISQLSIINYSHSDLPLQSFLDFPPYVIDCSPRNLQNETNGFEQTAREALLYLKWLTKYAPVDELNKFNNVYCEPLLGCSLEDDGTKEKSPLLFKHQVSDLSKMPLSPGQKYLLRLCVALNCNNIIPKDAILFLDEPESHLHPKVLLRLVENLRDRFKLGQIWIATHSIELISHFWYSEDSIVWYMANNKAKKMGSRPEGVLKGVLGDDNMRYHLYQFLSSPDAFVCNAFAVECLCKPKVTVKPLKKDPSAELASEKIQQEDVIVDFGAGKGRFLESYYSDYNRHPINYFAYDKYGLVKDDKTGKCSADYCKEVMKKNNIPIENYFGNENDFKTHIGKIQADKVLLINVLHEIAPAQWEDTFQNISRLLKDDGILLIVERKELTYGEKPFESDFFVIQQESLRELFTCDISDFGSRSYNDEDKVFAYEIPKQLLSNVKNETIKQAINITGKMAEARIKEIKKDKTEDNLWEKGVALAFWTHQFANARLFDFGLLDRS
jgi:energy-coupling factor transporter ATP-binding protein EcfA2